MAYADIGTNFVIPLGQHPTVSGAANVTTALGDNTNTSYVHLATQGNWETKWYMTNLLCSFSNIKGAIPANARITHYQPYIWTAEFRPGLAGLYDLELFLNDGSVNDDGTPAWNRSKQKDTMVGHYAIGSGWGLQFGSKYEVSRRSVVNHADNSGPSEDNVVPVIGVYFGSNTMAIGEVGLRVFYEYAPTMTINSVQTDGRGAAIPRFNISYSQASGLAKRGHAVEIWDAYGKKVYPTPTGNPSKIDEDTGLTKIEETTATLFSIDQALTPGYYSAAIRVAADWPEGYRDPPFWSDWKWKSFHVTGFVNDSPEPTAQIVFSETLGTPAISGAWNATRQGYDLSIESRDNILDLDCASVQNEGWQNDRLNCSILVDSSGEALIGDQCYKLTASSAADMTQEVYSGVGNGDFLAGETYEFGASFKAATTGRNCYIKVETRDSGYSVIDTVTTSSTADTTGSWTEITGSITLTAEAYFFHMWLVVESPASSEVHFTDALWISKQYTTADNEWTRGGSWQPVSDENRNFVPYRFSHFEGTYDASEWTFTNATGAFATPGATSSDDLGQALALTPAASGDVAAKCEQFFELPAVADGSTTYYFAHNMRSASTGRYCTALVEYYDSDYAYISDDAIVYGTNGTGWGRDSYDSTIPPSGAKYFKYTIEVAAANEVHYVNHVGMAADWVVSWESGENLITPYHQISNDALIVQYSDDSGETWETFSYQPSFGESKTFTDYLAKTGRMYRVRHQYWLDVDGDITFVTSGWSDTVTAGTITRDGMIVAVQGDPDTYWKPEYHSPNRKVQRKQVRHSRQFLGRSLATMESGEHSQRSVSVAVQEDNDPSDTLQAYSEQANEVVYADQRGLRLAGHIASYTIQDTNWGFEGSFEFVEGVRQ